MNAPPLSLDAVRALGRAMRSPSALPGRAIGGALRELIILHVSSINGCPVCSKMHAMIGRRVGLGSDDVRAARECEPPEALDDRTRVALHYAGVRTRGREGDDPSAVERFERAFSPPEQREIRAIVDLFTFNNRINNTWERWVPGAHRRRARMNLCGP